MDLTKAKMMDEDEDSYSVYHPNHGYFRVAKKGLDDHTHGYIRGMADGGEVNPSEPTKSSYATDTAFDAINEVKRLNEAEKAKELEDQSLVDQKRAETDERASLGLSPEQYQQKKQEEQSQEMGLQSQKLERQEKGFQPAEAPKQEVKPQETDIQKNAIQNFLNTQGKEDNLVSTLQSQFNDVDRDVAILKVKRDKDQANYEEALRTGVDSGKKWRDMKTENKIVAGFSVILSALGQGLSHGSTNMAMDVLNKIIDRDIEDQKQNLDYKKNLLAMNMEKYKDEITAKLETKKDWLTIAKMKLESRVMKNQALMNDLRVQEMHLNINNQIKQMNDAAAQREALRNYTGVGKIPAEAFIGPEGEKLKAKVVRRANGDDAVLKDEKYREDYNKKTMAIDSLIDSIRQIKQEMPSGLTNVGGFLKSHIVKDKADVLRADAEGTIATLYPDAKKEQIKDIVKNIIPKGDSLVNNPGLADAAIARLMERRRGIEDTYLENNQQPKTLKKVDTFK